MILISYFLIILYDKQATVIVTIWKPFNKVLTKFRKSWDIRTSVLDSFATFFLLSYIKVLSVTADILIPTQIFQLSSDKSKFGVYYSPSVTYFGDQHLPYAILAIILVTLFVSIPTMIFTFYSCQFFQKFLSLFPINWHFLHAFVDSFQGCYKDGTEPETFDYRWVSVLVILIRLALAIVFGITQSAVFFVYAVILVVIYVMIIVNTEPYKKAAHHSPSTDATFSILLSLLYISYLGGDIPSSEQNDYNIVMSMMGFLSAFAPVVYVIFLIGSWLVPRKRLSGFNKN